jgi:uncharacterized membrane-anchored protein
MVPIGIGRGGGRRSLTRKGRSMLLRLSSPSSHRRQNGMVQQSRFSDVGEMSSHPRVLAVLVVLTLASAGWTQGDPRAPRSWWGQGNQTTEAPINSIEWKKGPHTAVLGDVAQIVVPEGYVFVQAKDMRAFSELNQDPYSGELGALLPEDHSWVILFGFQSIGYVKDDEKDDLNAIADSLLEAIRSGNATANAERRQRGWAELEITGWEQRPFYELQTKNLTWAIRAQSQSGPVVNYKSRILGRSGVMSANLVIGPGRLAAVIPTYKGLLTGFSYKQGQSYTEFREGDKTATYGLTALIAGGATVVAAKTGWLVKFGKGIIAGAVAIITAIGVWLKKVFGGAKPTTTSSP